MNYVVALYDFSAQAEGDLDFKVGDRIEVVERTESVEDWWTGRLEGRTGVFPGMWPLTDPLSVFSLFVESFHIGNYVQDA